MFRIELQLSKLRPWGHNCRSHDPYSVDIVTIGLGELVFTESEYNSNKFIRRVSLWGQESLDTTQQVPEQFNTEEINYASVLQNGEGSTQSFIVDKSFEQPN